MSEYSSIIAATLRIIDKKGQDVTIITRTQGAYDPATSTAPVTTSSKTVKGVSTNFANSEIDGELIQRGDLRLLLAASGLTKPTLNDTVTLGAISYTIKNVEDISPGGESVLYKVQLRK